MIFLKATDGQRWYISLDGETFDLCRREPFLQDKLAPSVEKGKANDFPVEREDAILSRQQLEERGFVISEVTA